MAAAGGQIGAAATDATRECASAWAGDESRPLAETLTAIFAIESAQPPTSAVKQAGLVSHYGLAPAAYFELHEQLDVEHADQLRALISKRLLTPRRTS